MDSRRWSVIPPSRCSTCDDATCISSSRAQRFAHCMTRQMTVLISFAIGCATSCCHCSMRLPSVTWWRCWRVRRAWCATSVSWLDDPRRARPRSASRRRGLSRTRDVAVRATSTMVARAHSAATTSDGVHPPSSDEVERALHVVRGDVVATELSGGRRLSRSGQRLTLDEPLH